MEPAANIYINGLQLKELKTFKYLGIYLSSNGNCTSKTHIRIETTGERLDDQMLAQRLCTHVKI